MQKVFFNAFRYGWKVSLLLESNQRVPKEPDYKSGGVDRCPKEAELFNP